MSNIEKVYVVQHSYDYGENNEFTKVKFVGVYSSTEKAYEAIKRLRKLEEFNRYPITCFQVDVFTLNEDHWNEGFFSYSEE